MSPVEARLPLLVCFLVDAQVGIVAVNIFGAQQDGQRPLKRLCRRDQSCHIAAPAIWESAIVGHRIPSRIRGNCSFHTGRIGKGDIAMNELPTGRMTIKRIAPLITRHAANDVVE